MSEQRFNEAQRAFLAAAREGGVAAYDPLAKALTFPEIRELEDAGLVKGARRMFTSSRGGNYYGWAAPFSTDGGPDA